MGHLRKITKLYVSNGPWPLPFPITALCNKDCQSLAAGRWFSLGTPVSSTNKTDRHDITEILLKVALNTIKQINKQTNKNKKQPLVFQA